MLFLVAINTIYAWQRPGSPINGGTGIRYTSPPIENAAQHVFTSGCTHGRRSRQEWKDAKELAASFQQGPPAREAEDWRITWTRVLAIAAPFDPVGPVTCSFGVTERRAGETEREWLQRVDDQLYAAKAAGRNRVAVA
jgi:hypothetical protein